MQKSTRENEPEGRRTVFLVDDHAVVRQGIALVVNQQSDLRICGEAEDADKALRDITAAKPDVVVVDISLKGSHGLELVRDLRARFPHLPILVFTMHDEALYGEPALRAGALGYLTKTQPVDEVLRAIRRVLNGGVSVSGNVAAELLRHQIGGRVETEGSPVERLSDPEREVFQLIGQWKGTHQIAEELHQSVKTVEFYRDQIKSKLMITGAVELLHFATTYVEAKEQCGNPDKQRPWC